MKYLKLFENFEFREISFGSNGPVSKGIEKFTAKNFENFTDSEVNQIKEFLKKYGVNKFELKANLFFDEHGHRSVDEHGHRSIGVWIPYKDVKVVKKFIRIEKFKDEWFKVTDYPLFYECDQIGGVINFLKSILPKNVNESLNPIFYYEIDQDEFDKMITNPDLYTFYKRDILEINKSASKYDLVVNTINANIFAVTRDEWNISDEYGLDKYIESDDITIHKETSTLHYNIYEIDFYDTEIIEDFSINLSPRIDSTSPLFIPVRKVKAKDAIDIMKCKDDWFLVCYEELDDGEKYMGRNHPVSLKMYKCDQLDGLLKFICDKYSNQIKEAFSDEYDSEFDPNKYSERDNYWKGYLTKMKNDQDELKKELEEDPNYFSLVDEDGLPDLFAKLTDFGHDEVEKIKALFTDKYFVEEGKWKSYNADNIVTFIEAIRPKFCQIRIFKLEDEWYLVSTSDIDGKGRVFDKCDQFDGLKRLLNKTLVK